MNNQSERQNLVCPKKEHSTGKPFITDAGVGFVYRELEKERAFGHDEAPAHQLLIFLEGSCILNYDRFIGREFTAGQMVLIPRLSCYTGLVTSRLKVMIMSFEIPMRSQDKLILQSYYVYRAGMVYDFKPTFIRFPLTDFFHLLAGCLKQKMDTPSLHELKHQEFFLYLNQFYTKEEITSLFYEIMGRSLNFREFIFDNYKQVNTLNEMIGLSNMSRAVFFRKFKDEFNETAYQWMLKHKCQEIIRYLNHSDTTIKEVVNTFKFSSFSNFNRFCKRNFGCNPKQLVERTRQI